MEPVSFLGRVSEDGAKWAPNSPNAFKFAFKPFKGKETWVTVEEYKEIHTDPQRAYWWGVVVKLFMEAMAERDSYYVHRWILVRVGHCKEVVNKLTGEVTKEPLRTRRVAKDTYSRNIEAAQQLGAEFGIYIPDPNTPESQSLIAAHKRKKQEAEA